MARHTTAWKLKDGAGAEPNPAVICAPSWETFREAAAALQGVLAPVTAPRCALSILPGRGCFAVGSNSAEKCSHSQCDRHTFEIPATHRLWWPLQTAKGTVQVSAKPNYQFEKRQREQEKKKKKAEKALRKTAAPEVAAPDVPPQVIPESK
jgi:hypothetical protein